MTHSLPATEGGFVRMPRQWLNAPNVSPQAKCLLMIFCGSADDEGASWYSYGQLGDLLGRSRAAISNYVAELRSAGIIHTTTQTYGNGYNYRLLIRLVGWAEITAAWANKTRKKVEKRTEPAATKKSTSSAKQPSVSQQTESRVQDGERKDPKGPKTEIHKTYHRPASTPEWCSEDEKQWKNFRSNDRDPLSAVHGIPARTLLEKVIKIAAALPDQSGALVGEDHRNACEDALKRFMDAHQIEANEHAIADARKTLMGLARTQRQIDAAMEALSRNWKPFWKRLSTPKQLKEVVEPAVRAAAPRSAQAEEYATFQSRARCAQFHLKRLEAHYDKYFGRERGDE